MDNRLVIAGQVRIIGYYAVVRQFKLLSTLNICSTASKSHALDWSIISAASLWACGTRINYENPT
jgi:hypothetical protein